MAKRSSNREDPAREDGATCGREPASRSKSSPVHPALPLGSDSAARQSEEETLQEIREILERRVASRTQALQGANKKLQTQSEELQAINEQLQVQQEELQTQQEELRVQQEELQASERALRESEERFRVAQELSPDGFTILRPVRDEQGQVVDFTWVYENAAVARLNGTDPKAVLGRRLLELFPGHQGTPFLKAYEQVAQTGERCIFEAQFPDGRLSQSIWLRVVVVPAGENIAVLAQDITERKRAERELATRARIVEIFLTVPDDEMYEQVLNVVREVMQSEYGVFAYIDEDGAAVAPTMTRGVWDKCQVANKTHRFARETWTDNLWSRAILQKRTMIANEPAHVPEGHVPIRRAMVVPILFGGEVIGHYEIANKPTDYTDEDRRFMESLASYIAPVLHARLQRDRQEKHRREAEGALRRALDLLEGITENTPDLIAAQDTEFRYIAFNKAYRQEFQRIFGSDIEIGTSMIEALAHLPEDQRKTQELWGRALRGEAFTAVEELGDPERERKVFEIRYSPLCDRDGRLVGAAHIVRDITARKRTEEELRKANEQTTDIIESIRDNFFVLDRRWRFTHVNAESERQFRKSREELLGHNVWELFPEAVGTAYWENYHKSMNERVPTRFQAYYPPHNIWTEVSVYPTREGIAVYCLDISNLKRTEEALRESERRLSLAMDAGQLVPWEIDLVSGEVKHSPQLFQLFGLDPNDEFHSREQWRTLIHEDDRSMILQSVETTKGGQEHHIEYRIRHPDGTIHWHESHAVPVADAEGRYVRLVGYALDITARKRVEEALRQWNTTLESRVAERTAELVQAGEKVRAERQRFLEVLNTLPAIIDIIRPDHRIEWTNRAYREALGDNQGCLCYASQFGRDTPCEECQAFTPLRTGQPHHWEWTLPNGRTFDIYNFPFADADGAPMILEMNLDITERKRAEARLRELNKTLEHRARQLQKLTLEISETEDRERKRMAEILHDDLQQQLAAAKFHMSILKSRARGDASLQTIADQIDQMLMDAIAKSRSLSHELSPAVMHHGDFGETCRWLASQVQIRHGLVVHVQTAGEVCPESEALKGFLYKAVQELVFNVVKHARVSEARLRVRRRGRWIYLSVADRGRGFDPQGLREAAGFGLFSIRERVELLGGRMKIRSAPGQGSTFSLVVPDGTGPVTRDPSPVTQVTDHEPRATLRVLLADDHEIVRQGLRSLLSEEPDVAVVGEAANGREAVDLALRVKPDVIIMDMSMPLIEGHDATRQIKTYLPQTRVIALSMYDHAEKIEAMYGAGAERYVLKTAPSEELLAAIRGKESG